MQRISLSQYLYENIPVQGEPGEQLRRLLETVARACKAIAAHVARGALSGTLGSAGSANVHGETQQELDLIANRVLTDAMHWTGCLAGLASEELEHPQIIPTPAQHRSTPESVGTDSPEGIQFNHAEMRGRYLLVFDPLDGSSNIAINSLMGTIFSVLPAPSGRQPDAADFLQPGNRQIAAGYAVYGPAAMLVLTLGRGVAAFTLDRETGSWLLTHPQLCIPEECSEYAINASNARHWEAPVARYVAELNSGSTGVRERDFNMRWLAAMVGDVHRVLCRGGIFMYPLDEKTRGKGGRLRLLYEANPMAFIVEQAGGAASTGRRRILDLEPQALHQRVPVILGSKREVERLGIYHDQPGAQSPPGPAAVS